MGAGRTELVSAIFGACPDATHGDVLVAGNRIEIRSPADAIDHGIALLTEDRKAFGLFLGQSIAFNTTAESWLHQQMQYDLWHAEQSRKRLRVRKLAAA